MKNLDPVNQAIMRNYQSYIKANTKYDGNISFINNIMDEGLCQEVFRDRIHNNNSLSLFQQRLRYLKKEHSKINSFWNMTKVATPLASEGEGEEDMEQAIKRLASKTTGPPGIMTGLI